VKADKLLAAARWAKGAYDKAVALSNNDQRSKSLRSAHLSALKADPEKFDADTRAAYPSKLNDYNHKVVEIAKEYSRATRARKKSELVRPKIAARREAARKLHGDRAHQMLAAEPLAKLADITKIAFRDLAGEHVTTDRGRVYRAAKRLEQARTAGNPLLLVLYRGHGHTAELDHETKRISTEILMREPVVTPLASYVTVAVPMRQFTALTKLVDLPNYELKQRSYPAIILARNTGEQYATFTKDRSPEKIAESMWTLLQESRLARAEVLKKQGNLDDSAKFLDRVLSSPAPAELKEKARRQVTKVRFAQAEKLAAAGKKSAALRVLHKIRKLATDSAVQNEATARMAKLRNAKTAAK